jgi:hypothetical protein
MFMNDDWELIKVQLLAHLLKVHDRTYGFVSAVPIFLQSLQANDLSPYNYSLIFHD